MFGKLCLTLYLLLSLLEAKAIALEKSKTNSNNRINPMTILNCTRKKPKDKLFLQVNKTKYIAITEQYESVRATSTDMGVSI